MFRATWLIIVSTLLTGLLPGPALSHHSYTMFDMDKNVSLEGIVKEVQWTNPHIWLQLVVKDAATGQDVEWAIEGASPNMLVRAGWSRRSLKPGDKATVVVHPVKVGGKGNSGSLASIVIDGKRILGGQAPAAAEESK